MHLIDLSPKQLISGLLPVFYLFFFVGNEVIEWREVRIVKHGGFRNATKKRWRATVTWQVNLRDSPFPAAKKKNLHEYNWYFGIYRLNRLPIQISRIRKYHPEQLQHPLSYLPPLQLITPHVPCQPYHPPMGIAFFPVAWKRTSLNAFS